MAPDRDWIGFDDPASAALDRLQGGAQRQTGHALSTVLLVDDETRHPPDWLA